LKQLVLAGGRHRHAAVMILWEQHKARQRKLEEQIKALRAGEAKKPLTSKKRAELQEAVGQLGDVTEHLKTLGRWGVYVYNSSKYS